MKKKRKQRIGFRIIAFTVLIICAVVLFNKYRLDREYNTLVKQQETLQQEIAEETERSEDVEEYRVYVKTKKFIEDVARNILGLVDPEDIVIKDK